MTLSYNFPKLHHSNLHPNLKKVKVIERSRDVTPRLKYDKSKGHPSFPCASNLVQFRILFTKLWHFERIGTHHFSLIGCHLKSVSRSEPVFELNLAPSEKRPTYEFLSDSGIFLSSYRVIVTSCNLCARAKGKGHIYRAKNGRKHFLRRIGQANSNLVAVLVSDLWLWQAKMAQFFFTTIGRYLECAIQTELHCWTRVSPNRKEVISSISAQFYHMPERYERVRIGWHCTKVKDHAELKIERKQSKDP